MTECKQITKTAVRMTLVDIQGKSGPAEIEYNVAEGLEDIKKEPDYGPNTEIIHEILSIEGVLGAGSMTYGSDGTFEIKTDRVTARVTPKGNIFKIFYEINIPKK